MPREPDLDDLRRYAVARTLFKPTTLPAALTWSGDTSKRYDIGFAAGNTNAAFTLTAIPRNPGPQAGDKCGNYTLNQAGLRGANGKTSGQSGYDPDCWGK